MNSWLILMTITTYFGLLLLISWVTGRKNSGNDTFYTGNRNSPWYVIAFGMVGASISGVTFVSVPGLVRQIDMTYMQMVFGFFFGYVVVAKILLPIYYRLNLISIYAYLGERIGWYGYKTGASFFLGSKLISAAIRLYLVVWILQTYIFEQWGIPFAVTTVCCVLVVWLYTFRSGIQTIIRTDVLQTFCLVAMLIAILWVVKNTLELDMAAMMQTISQSPHFRIFEFQDWGSTQHFVKQFFSGVFITIAMTGLDMDMMQKNLACRNLKDAQKNMVWYGLAFTPLNFLFLCLGILLLVASSQLQIALPASGDEILPMFCASGLFGHSVLVFFAIGIIAAAFSSADSALTALTTSVCVDIIQGSRFKVQDSRFKIQDSRFKVQDCRGVLQPPPNIKAPIVMSTAVETSVIQFQTDSSTAVGMTKGRGEPVCSPKTRMLVHAGISILFILVILAFKALNNRSLIDAIYTIVSYTYGPLLGLFAFGLFTKRKTKDKAVPFICIASPIICYLINHFVYRLTGYFFGYELLILNGLITFAGLFFFKNSKCRGGFQTRPKFKIHNCIYGNNKSRICNQQYGCKKMSGWKLARICVYRPVECW